MSVNVRILHSPQEAVEFGEPCPAMPQVLGQEMWIGSPGCVECCLMQDCIIVLKAEELAKIENFME